jgi:ATP-dependent Zn protease
VPDGERHPSLHERRVNDSASALAREWKRLGRAATFVALLTSPVLFTLLYRGLEWGLLGSLLGTIAGVAIFRGLIDVLAHRFIPAPTLYGANPELKDEDVVSRRRLWYWRKKFRNVRRLFVIFGVLVAIAMFYNSLSGGDSSISGGIASIGDLFTAFGPIFFGYLPIIFILFFANFLILFGPLLLLGAGQIKGYEPGDADWGVKLEDVRGQAEAKEEITRVVSLWQSGEEFEKAGGKRERGVLFLGAPGTGKTMLSKGIATSFNCPFVSIPGSGFAQTFIGMDAVLVRYLAMKAKRLARKWGGQCIVFIDEIDAVGMRRQSLGSGFQPLETSTIHDQLFYGPQGALTWDGDLVLETKAWRDRMFEMRAEPHGPVYPPAVEKLAGALRNMMIPGMMGGGGGLALNQLLVVMDGIDDPPLMKRIRTKRINTFLDALYIVPRKLGKLPLRLPPPKPNKEEIYFIGACNVSLNRLDPALTRPGRMGRHIYFRTPTWEDRRDIFELYLGKVAHAEALDEPRKRDELARITNGYSPAMIDQVCSMALTYAHSDGRQAFEWEDLLEAMTTVESGVAIGQPYPSHEERSIAIHEAGHAVCSHLYGDNVLSTRLSIRKRGSSGGHHAAMEIEDRFVDWRSEQVGRLIWSLGAMAAEHVFYEQTTTGVGGDVYSTTALAVRMVGRAAMGPTPLDLSDRIDNPELRREEEERIMERFHKLGEQIIHRSGGGMLDDDGVSGVLNDRGKHRLAAALIGQSFVIAFNTIRHNREGVARVADELVARGEFYGDDVGALLDDANLERPQMDVLDEASWPVI